MTLEEALLFVALPYSSITLFVAGHIWRYRHDKFGWTSRSTQLLERRWLAWGSNLFHYGALAAIGGHVVGLLIPEQLTHAVGISEGAYHLFAAAAGTVAGLACIAGFVILVGRRAYFPRVRRTTTRTDIVVYLVLAAIIVLGLIETIGFNTLGSGYNYRPTIGVWFRSLLWLHPEPRLIAGAPLVYQLHATLPWLLYAVWPFSRLVHAWSLPWQYLGRPNILYRRRYGLAKR